MVTADDETVDVRVAELNVGEYYLDAGTNPISGVYRLGDDRVVMQKPDNPRMNDFVWRRDSAERLTMIAEPSVELSGQRLLTSTMVKLP